MRSVHFTWGDSGPDLLLDLLPIGFAELGHSVTWWPDKRHINAEVPSLFHPTLQVWSGQTIKQNDWTYRGWVKPIPTKRWLEEATFTDLLISTHAHGAASRLIKIGSVSPKLVAIDAYDLPLFSWRDQMKAAGFKVFAREKPRPGELPIDYVFNPLFAPTPPLNDSARFIPILMAGDLDVGRRRQYASAVARSGIYGAQIAERLPYGEWQDALARSRWVVCPHGSGEKTYRLWEAAAAGCALLVERFTPGNEPTGLVDGENCVFFGSGGDDDPDGLKQTIERVCRDANTSARIGHAAYETAWSQKTPKAMAEYILKVST